MSPAHIPVLLSEVLAAFSAQPLHTFIDCTLGLGGHAHAILSAHPEIATYIGCDQDPSAMAIATQQLARWSHKLHLLRQNFADLPRNSLPQADGILVDLGVSSLQLDTPDRGFSFRFDSPLDMRMDPTKPLTAADIVNTYSAEELGHIFRKYGEEPQWRSAAHAIVRARTQQPILTTQEFLQVLMPIFPAARRRKALHPATLIFQALRLCVNQELEVLETLLPWAIDQLPVGGRLAIMSFHSLEDRIVKQAFQQAASDKENTSGCGGLFIDKAPTVTIVTRKAVGCSESEAERNPRARSARLRVIEKL